MGGPLDGIRVLEVLLEFGYSWDDITGLREAGAL